MRSKRSSREEEEEEEQEEEDEEEEENDFTIERKDKLPCLTLFLGSGPGGNRRGRSPVEYRGESVRPYVRPSVRPSPPRPLRSAKPWLRPP